MKLLHNRDDCAKHDFRILASFYCTGCAAFKPCNPPGSFTTGYGVGNGGELFCFACCGKRDRADMIKTGRATLYLTARQPAPAPATIGKHEIGIAPFGSHKVGNWPGTLEFPVYYMKRGRHNVARTRYDVWFNGPDGRAWHGVQYGENTQLCHCKRIGR